MVAFSNDLLTELRTPKEFDAASKHVRPEDMDLGTGPENLDGTGVGITSIGNLRNPFLPFDGASVSSARARGTPSGC